jgi:hypothetical protein
MTYNPTMSRPGLVNATGTAYDALFLKQFSGEVMTAFEQTNVMIPLTTVRTITKGKSAQFPSIGVAAAAYHSPGKDLLNSAEGYGTAFKQAAQTITVDDLLVSTTFIPEIEELENHYDVRSTYSSEMGKALAYTADRQLVQLVTLAARATDPNDDYADGEAITVGDISSATLMASNSLDTVVRTFIEYCYSVAQKFDDKLVPQDNRHCIVKPELFYKLYKAGISGSSLPIIINRDIVDGANGSLERVTDTIKIANITIHKSTHTPFTDVGGSAAEVTALQAGAAVGLGQNISTGPSGYQGDFRGTVAVFWHPQAIGTLKLMDLSMQSEYRIDRQGTLLVARYAMGHGILRPACAIELKIVA